MLILGIETTCDETAAAVVKDGKEILSNIVASQIDLHSPYGGVVPELACRRHIELLLPIIEEALQKAMVALADIDLLAVAHGPGLIGALLIGVTTAQSLALATQKPLVGINHIEAHLYAALMSQQKEIPFPAIGVVLSGGHTSLVHMEGIGNYTLIGQTVDDAIGEAFDKSARILGLPYPGGPAIEKLACEGDCQRYPFSAGKVKGKPFDFSFSGLKTALLYACKDKTEQQLTTEKRDIAASFQQAAFSDVIKKSVLAAKEYDCSSLVLGGGVTNNKRLREFFGEQASHLTIAWPSFDLSLDNAAMIAGLAYHKKALADPLQLQALPRIPFAR